MVIVLADHEGKTPDGNPVTEIIPDTPVVVWVIEGSKVLIITVGFEEAALTVLAGITVIVPVALIFPQPPVNGIV